VSEPFDPRDTIPIPDSASELPIQSGDAARVMLAALANLTAAVVAVERICMALARAADQQAHGGSAPSTEPPKSE
jgi:hypothetical protein